MKTIKVSLNNKELIELKASAKSRGMSPAKLIRLFIQSEVMPRKLKTPDEIKMRDEKILLGMQRHMAAVHCLKSNNAATVAEVGEHIKVCGFGEPSTLTSIYFRAKQVLKL